MGIYGSHPLMALVLEMNDEVNGNGWKDSRHETFYEPNNKVALKFPRGASEQQ